jgi:hypothetical protein
MKSSKDVKAINEETAQIREEKRKSLLVVFAKRRKQNKKKLVN